MKRFLPCVPVLGVFFASVVLSSVAVSAPKSLDLSTFNPTYHLIKSIPLEGEDGWDYLMLDSAMRRLYVSRSTHVAVIDIDSGKVVGDIPDTAGVHGIAIDSALGRGFTSNGRANTVTIFDLKTLKKLGDVAVGQGPDAIINDPGSKRVFCFNGHGQSVSVINAASGQVVGTIALPGKPEFAVSDGRGHIFDNLEDKNELVVLDARRMKIQHTWPLGTGTAPSGLALDTQTHRLFAVCDNQQMVVINAKKGQVVATLPIGNGPDACAFDPATKLVFSPNGEDGTMTVIQETSPDNYQVAGTLTTQDGARTMTLDPVTHHLFTIAAKALPTDPNAPQQHRRRYEAGSVTVLEYGSKEAR